MLSLVAMFTAAAVLTSAITISQGTVPAAFPEYRGYFDGDIIVYSPGVLGLRQTVNEMMFERPIAMIRETSSSLRRRLPQLEALTNRGAHFIQLDTIDGHFDGFIFRKLGDQVRAGEVIALTVWWWGIKTKEYVSPVNGTIVYFQREAGIIGIGTGGIIRHPSS